MSKEASPKNKSFMDKFTDFAMKIASPLAKFAEFPVIAAVQDGLIAVMPIIMIGSIFLIFYVLGSPSIGTSGKPLIGFLAPLASKFIVMNSLTMNFMAFYAALTISMSYGEKLEVEEKTAALLGIGTFLIFTINGVIEGQISVASFNAGGLFVAILTSIISVKIYKIFIDKDIRIKLPESVPPNIGNAFSALIPYLVIFTIAWTIRTILNFDMVAWLSAVLQPYISAADNVYVYTLYRFLTNLLWAAGLHGDNMLNPIFTPFTTMWLQENAAAMQAGLPMPHVWTYQGIERITHWPATVWPLIFLMLTSKVKHLRTLGFVALAPGIFTIVEPVVYGLPIAFNPFLIIPFILIGVITAIISYLAVSLGFIGKFFASLPWATPPFILGPAATGDWKTIILIALVFIIGLIIYYPFFKMYENSILEKEKSETESKTD